MVLQRNFHISEIENKLFPQQFRDRWYLLSIAPELMTLPETWWKSRIYQFSLFASREIRSLEAGGGGGGSGAKKEPQSQKLARTAPKDFLNNSRALPNIVYFLSSLRAQTAKTLIRTKSGVSADSRKSGKKCGKPHFLQKWRKPHFFVQINVFAVWALRLDRKYTNPIKQGF